MNILNVITNRRTLHSFNERKVSNHLIDNALIAANHAPSHRLTFPWRFNIISMEMRKTLFKDYIKIKFTNEISKEKFKLLERKFMIPSHLIVASQLLHSDLEIQREDYAACSCAIENLMLYLSGEGIGSKWATGKNTRSDKAYEVMEINRKQETIIGFIWIGYGEPSSKIIRPNIKTIVKDWN
tara:strand:+ start:527 stop:1075 length:549 start_codon:yes stop_codon:yes gene_type:complete